MRGKVNKGRKVNYMEKRNELNIRYTKKCRSDEERLV
jgi:hypothetical protein